MLIAASLFFMAQIQAATPTAKPDSVPFVHPPTAGYVPHRVYRSKKKRFEDFEAMMADVAKADVVFLGEQHDDPGTHRLERAVLEGIARRREKVVVALEMFERDAQPALNDYLAGKLPEADFLKGARPWPRYATDYRPLVEFARDRGWPVIAGNVPRRLASLVGRKGLAGVDSLPPADRAFVAAQLNCPRDKYYDRFKETMGDMSGHGQKITPAEAAAMVGRFYDAQCVKDETMGEAIATARAASPGAVVVHVNGAFHSDYRLGTAQRAKNRLDGARIAVISFVPVEDLDTANGKKIRKLGDYVVFTLKPPAPVKPVSAPAPVPAKP